MKVFAVSKMIFSEMLGLVLSVDPTKRLGLGRRAGVATCQFYVIRKKVK